jgi:5-methylcytosine-specific restriction protein B
MTPQPVEAVFFFRYNKQVSQACYGRLGGSRYTKNYIQVSAEAAGVLDRALGRSEGSRVNFEFAWPGGIEPGELRRASGAAYRTQLAWKQTGHAPKPWKLGDLEDPQTTIPGVPTRTNEADADTELSKLRQQHLEPWLLAVKLADEPGLLHARAYLEYPPAGHEHLGLAQLPSPILHAIHALPARAQSGVLLPPDLRPPAPRARAIVERIRTALENDPNVLLVGPPGTGKTVALEDLRELAEYEADSLLFDPERWHDGFSPQTQETKVVSLVFHPSYAYENFVAGLFPESLENGGYRLVAKPGPLISLAHWTASSDRRALLILDEFNRGPAAAIFGDTLALLDESKRSDPPQKPGAHIERPHAGTDMLVAPEFADVHGERSAADELRLPAGVQIVAALNSSDRSVAPLDAALRRRFAILPVAPDLDVLAEHLGIARASVSGAYEPHDQNPEQWTALEVRELALRILATLNERLAFVLGDDFLLGHALLWPVGAASDGTVREALCQAFDQRIVASLRLTFADQDDLLAAVLGTGQPGAGGSSSPRIAGWREPPAAVANVAIAHLELGASAEMPWSQAAQALRAILDP